MINKKSLIRFIKMGKNEIECPHCNNKIDPIRVMGDSDWDDQEYEWCDDIHCPNCDNTFRARQCDVETIRFFESEKYE